jgi:hypothetical protein
MEQDTGVPFFLRDGISKGEDFYDEDKQKVTHICNDCDVE